MENKWHECLDIIRQEVKDEWIMTTWFECITCGSFDAERRVLTLSVPSKYVVEFIEHYFINMLKMVLIRVYGEGVTLHYRLPAPKTDRGQSPDITAPDRNLSPYISIPNARERLEKGLAHFLGAAKAKWLPEYDHIADWLVDNKGRGLLLVGTSGLGKSLICEKILPHLLGGDVAIVSSREMAQNIDTLLQQRCVIIDDLGKEPVSEMVNYRKRTPFFELCDEAERRGMLLIINTNLSTTPVNDPHYPTSIKERYGDAVLDRLRGITRVVVLKGESLR